MLFLSFRNGAPYRHRIGRGAGLRQWNSVNIRSCSRGLCRARSGAGSFSHDSRTRPGGTAASAAVRPRGRLGEASSGGLWAGVVRHHLVGRVTCAGRARREDRRCHRRASRHAAVRCLRLPPVHHGQPGCSLHPSVRRSPSAYARIRCTGGIALRSLDVASHISGGEDARVRACAGGAERKSGHQGRVSCSYPPLRGGG